MSKLIQNDLNYYKPRHFHASELVPPDVYKAMGERSLILLDVRILISLDNLREYFDVPVTVNNWYTKGKFTQRGFRTDAGTGAKYSQHRYGRGIDCDVKNVTAEKVRQIIIDHQDWQGFQYITALEIDVPWVHMDCRNVDRAHGIVLIKP